MRISVEEVLAWFSDGSTWFSDKNTLDSLFDHYSELRWMIYMRVLPMPNMPKPLSQGWCTLSVVQKLMIALSDDMEALN